MWLFIVFLAVPLIEITLFIQIGGAIGLGWTLVTVVITAILGTWLVRNQGLLAMSQLKSSFSELQDPTEPLVHGAMILFSGALLLTPGFFTDAVGFALLVPGIRTAMFNAIRKRVNVQTFGTGGPGRAGWPIHPPHSSHPPQDGDIIDADYTEVSPEESRPSRPSGWTKH